MTHAVLPIEYLEPLIYQMYIVQTIMLRKCILEFLISSDWRKQSLSGQLPDQISQLLSLKYLFLNDNNLNGSIPTSIGSLNQLRAL